MRYAGMIKNDFSAAPGLCVSFFVQGCPLRCTGCHNPQSWDFKGGYPVTDEVFEELYEALTANGINRNLAIMGGEPLCPENQELTLAVINYVRAKMPDIKIYLYTGYMVGNLTQIGPRDKLAKILAELEWMIEGPFQLHRRDVTLKYRGSTNQRILKGPLTIGKKFDIINLEEEENKGECDGSINN